MLGEIPSVYYAPGEQSGNKELAPASVIGLVLYDQNKKSAVVGATPSGDLRCAYFTEQELPYQPVYEKSPQVLTLRNYQEVEVLQAHLGATQIDTKTTIRQQEPFVYVNFTFKNPQTEQEESLYLEEGEVTAGIMSPHHNIAVFHAPGKEDEYALIIDQYLPDKKRALVVFLHPQEAILGLDSMRGVAEFFRNLNNEFVRKTNLPNKVILDLDVYGVLPGDLKEVLTRLDDYHKNGFLEGSSARIEMFKSAIIGAVYNNQRGIDFGYAGIAIDNLFDYVKRWGNKPDKKTASSIQIIMSFIEEVVENFLSDNNRYPEHQAHDISSHLPEAVLAQL